MKIKLVGTINSNRLLSWDEMVQRNGVYSIDLHSYANISFIVVLNGNTYWISGNTFEPAEEFWANGNYSFVETNKRILIEPCTL